MQLNDDARFLLLQLLGANGGSVGQLSIVEALRDLVSTGHVETVHGKGTKNLAGPFEYVLTAKGKQQLADVQQKLAARPVKELKHKKGRVTVIEYKGNRYALERPGIPVNNSKPKGANE